MSTYQLRFGVGLLLAGLTLASSGCDEDAFTPEDRVFVEDAFGFPLPVEDRSRLSVEGINGTIGVFGRTQVDSIRVEGERRVGSSTLEDAEAHLDSLEVLVTDLGDAHRIETRQPNPANGRQYIVDYELTLPDTLQLTITCANGAIEVRDVRDSVSITTANGSISLIGIEGSVAAGLANGEVTAEVVLPGGGTIDLSTGNGPIVLRVPASTSAMLEATVAVGTISVRGLTIQDEVRTSTSLRGTLGAGEGTISLRTGNGSVTIEGF